MVKTADDKITSNEYFERNDNEWQYVRFRNDNNGTADTIHFGLRSLDINYNLAMKFLWKDMLFLETEFIFL